METNPGIAILRNLLDEDARKFTSAEIELKNRLEVWTKGADSLQLKTFLHEYLHYVEEHVAKLQAFFEDENISYISLNNRVMQAFIEEAEEKLSGCTDAAVKDACLLAAVQAINHFKISAYGTAAAFARRLELEKAAAIFRELEINERNIDHNLTVLAEQEINNKAIAPIVLGQ